MQDLIKETKITRFMSGKMKIYACSGVGSNGNTRGYDYWLDDTETISNTQAVNTLLARINLCYSEAINLPNLSDEEVAERLDKIDLYSVCLFYADKYKDNTEELHHAGQVVGHMYAGGAFLCDALDNDTRDKNLTALFDQAESLFDKELRTDEEFMQWWHETVEERNKVGLTIQQQQKIKDVENQGVSGWEENKDLANYLTRGSEYFLYTYFTDAQLAKLPYVFTRKKKGQMYIYNYCKALFVGTYGSEQEMKAIIRSGIIGYFKDTPENVCKTIYENSTKHKNVAVGDAIVLTVEAIVSIVTAVLTFIGSVIAAICTMCAQIKIAEIQQVDQSVIDANIPHSEEIESLGGESSGANSWLLYGAIGLALILFLRKK